jgi:ribosomal subunit interface protein
MIHKLEIAGVHMSVGEDLKKHVLKKIGRVDKYILKRVRASVHAEVKLKEGKAKGKVTHTSEVILHLPNEVITVKETANNIFTAVNQVEEKLKHQLHRYKEQQSGPKLRQHLLARIRRRGFVEL